MDKGHVQEDEELYKQKTMVKGTVLHKTLSSIFSRNTNHCTGVTNSGTGYVAQLSKIARCLCLVTTWNNYHRVEIT